MFIEFFGTCRTRGLGQHYHRSAGDATHVAWQGHKLLHEAPIIAQPICHLPHSPVQPSTHPTPQRLRSAPLPGVDDDDHRWPQPAATKRPLRYWRALTNRTKSSTSAAICSGNASTSYSKPFTNHQHSHLSLLSSVRPGGVIPSLLHEMIQLNLPEVNATRPPGLTRTPARCIMRIGPPTDHACSPPPQISCQRCQPVSLPGNPLTDARNLSVILSYHQVHTETLC